ncbi:hypothetical protein ECOK1180_0065 [Escherichia coli OK1180]|nr:hypothetical protein ECOK1180_0065 [Escherichia coli OK1180]
MLHLPFHFINVNVIRKMGAIRRYTMMIYLIPFERYHLARNLNFVQESAIA